MNPGERSQRGQTDHGDRGRIPMVILRGGKETLLGEEAKNRHQNPKEDASRIQDGGDGGSENQAVEGGCKKKN